MVVMEDEGDKSDVLRQKRGGERQYVYDAIFGEDSTQVRRRLVGVNIAREMTEDFDEYNNWAGDSGRFPAGTGMFLSAIASKPALQPIAYRESRDGTRTWSSRPLVSRSRLCGIHPSPLLLVFMGWDLITPMANFTF
jgi:hypothetical protein